MKIFVITLCIILFIAGCLTCYAIVKINNEEDIDFDRELKDILEAEKRKKKKK